MPVSRPSRVGDPTPPVYSRQEGYTEEEEKVDKRLAQLEEARAKAAASLPRRRQEALRSKWEGLQRGLRLSRHQESLLRAVDGKAPPVHDAIEVIYKVRWNRLGKKRRVKHFGRLPILADALEEAGCTNEEMLRHCRGQQRCWACLADCWSNGLPIACGECAATGWTRLEAPHASGCFVLDSILGKN